MKFTDLYPSFGDFKTSLNDLLANTVADTDTVFYNYIASIFNTRDFLSDNEEIVRAQVFSKWKNVKLKWVKLLKANETELLNLLTQESQNENYTGSLTESDLEAKKFLSTGASSKFKPAIIDRIGVVVGLPDFFDEIAREFEPLFFNISPTFLKSLDPNEPKTKIGTDLVFLANPGPESLDPNDRLQSQANAHFRAAIKALEDSGGAVLPEKLSWLDSQLETLPNTTEEVFLNAVFIYYIKNGQKLFLATTILMLLDELETNSNNIAGNSSDIVDLETNIAGLVSQLNVLGARLTEAESDIADNETLISENTNSIQTIAGKTYIFEILDGLNQGEAFEKVNAHNPTDFNKLSLFFNGCVFSIQSSSETEFDLQGITQTNKQIRLSEIILTKDSTEPISKVMRAPSLNDSQIINTASNFFPNLSNQKEINFRLISTFFLPENITQQQLYELILSLPPSERKHYQFAYLDVIYQLSSFHEESHRTSSLEALVALFSSRVLSFSNLTFAGNSSLPPSVNTSFVDIQDEFVENRSSLIPYSQFPNQRLLNELFFPLSKPNWPLEFYQNGQLSVITDNETPVSRYTFSTFSPARFDKGGEVGFTFSADLEINTPVQEPKLTLALESIFKFTDVSWNSEKFVPVVNLTSPSGKIYSTHAIYKKGSLDYHYIHIFLGGFENIPNALDSEAGEWIIHFKLHHKSELSTLSTGFKNVKSIKERNKKNAKSRLN